MRQGQPLYQIDPSLYRAAVNQAQANRRQRASATLEAAQVRADRYKPLAEMEAVAKQDYTDAAAQARQAPAAVAQNSAALETARINLRFTTRPGADQRPDRPLAVRPRARWSPPTRPIRSR